MVIPQFIQTFVVKWYHTYLLHPGLDQTEEMIRQYSYWPSIREAVHGEVTRCDVCQRTKLSINKYGKLPDKLEEETPGNKLRVDLLWPYKISRNRKEPLILKAVTMIDPIYGWFHIMQYNYKKAMTIANLVETTWLVRYPRPVDITY